MKNTYLSWPSFSSASRTIALTTVAMMAFAANSVLCRLAFTSASIDPATFTLVRLTSGTVMLLIIWLAIKRGGQVCGSWSAAIALFAYTSAFSFAYISLSVGAGALLLFGAVQATMVMTGLVRGERQTLAQWLGFVLALVGLAALLAPGVSAPPVTGAFLMLVAGVAWGAYSLLGRGVVDPVSATAGNFLRTLPMALALCVVVVIFSAKLSVSGLIYAALSGAVASGLGYTIWYAAIPGLTLTQGASVQLSVPVITALGGALVLGEGITVRLTVSSLAILSGIGLVIASKRKSEWRARAPAKRATTLE